MESSSDDNVCVSPDIFPETKKEAALYLKKLWKTLSSPMPEKIPNKRMICSGHLQQEQRSSIQRSVDTQILGI